MISLLSFYLKPLRVGLIRLQATYGLKQVLAPAALTAGVLIRYPRAFFPFPCLHYLPEDERSDLLSSVAYSGLSTQTQVIEGMR